MLGWVLAVWVAFAGKDGEKLPGQWATCYRALRCPYYTSQDVIDWIAYYHQCGSQINGSSNVRVNYAPVFVSPTLQWAVPNSCLNGPPTGPYGSYGQYPNK